MVSAAARTFAIPELLEQILLAVSTTFAEDTKSVAALLRARRVSQTFKAIIDESPDLQSALWFPPPSYKAVKNKYNYFVLKDGYHELEGGGSVRIWRYEDGTTGRLLFTFSGMEGREVSSGYWSRMYPCYCEPLTYHVNRPRQAAF